MIENSLKLHIQQTVVSIVSFLWDFLCVCILHRLFYVVTLNKCIIHFNENISMKCIFNLVSACSNMLARI